MDICNYNSALNSEKKCNIEKICSTYTDIFVCNVSKILEYCAPRNVNTGAVFTFLGNPQLYFTFGKSFENKKKN